MVLICHPKALRAGARLSLNDRHFPPLLVLFGVLLIGGPRLPGSFRAAPTRYYSSCQPKCKLVGFGFGWDPPTRPAPPSCMYRVPLSTTTGYVGGW